MKKCTACLIEKSFAEFYRYRGTKLLKRCKPCQSKFNAAYRVRVGYRRPQL